MIPPCCYLISLCLASVPFLSGGFAARSSTGKVGERIGKEWVIDKSLLDFIFSYLYLYFIALDFPTSVFPLSDYPTTEMPTTAKKGKARLFMPCPLSSISCRGGCYRPDLKSSKQVVHLRGYLLKVQIYQPFSRTGYILPWHTNRIFVICPTLHVGILFLSIAYFLCKVEGIIQMNISPFIFILCYPYCISVADGGFGLDFRPCLKIDGMPNGERFFRQSRQIFAGGLTPGKKI